MFARTMHLFISQDLQDFPKLLERQHEMAMLSNTTSKRHYFGHDMWLIFDSGESEKTLNSIASVLKSTLVRLDSGLFGFVKTDKGKFLEKLFLTSPRL